MQSAREYLRDRICDVVEEAGGFISDHADELIDSLVETVLGDSRSAE